MSLLPFGELPPYRPRRFLPRSIDLGSWPAIEPLFQKLEARAPRLGSVAELQDWLLDWSELSAALDEELSRRSIAMTCHTENPEAEKAYLHFIEQVEPQLKPRQFNLSKIYLTHPLRNQLPRDRYAVLDRDVQVTVELFRDENVPLETKEARRSQQYQKLVGSLSVQFQGKEQTLVQMAKYLEEPTALCASKPGN